MEVPRRVFIRLVSIICCTRIRGFKKKKIKSRTKQYPSCRETAPPPQAHWQAKPKHFLKDKDFWASHFCSIWGFAINVKPSTESFNMSKLKIKNLKETGALKYAFVFA